MAHLAKFVQTCAAPTTQLRVATLDVEPETGAPPIALGLVDTPALDARDTPAAERVLADIVRFIDARFADAVEDVSKAILHVGHWLQTSNDALRFIRISKLLRLRFFHYIG